MITGAANSLTRSGVAQAAAHLQQLTEPERQMLVNRYNAQQTVAMLQVTSRPSRIAVGFFERWLANDLWGEPSVEQVLQHEQKVLSASLPV